MASSILSFLHRPGLAAALSFVLAVAACSKKEPPPPSTQAPALSANPSPTVILPEPMEKKGPPFVSPGHLPPNPRVPQSGMLTGGDPVKKQLLAPPLPSAQHAPSGASTTAKPVRPMPVTEVHTPEQGNLARQRALQEMFILRAQKSAASQPSGTSANPGIHRSPEKVAPLKTQP